MEYTISAAARILGANAVGAGDYAFSELSVDSRRLSFPDSTLFFAIETGTNDGHKYVNDAYRMGVRCFVVSHDVPGMERLSDAVFLRVPDTL